MPRARRSALSAAERVTGIETASGTGIGTGRVTGIETAIGTGAATVAIGATVATGGATDQ